METSDTKIYIDGQPFEGIGEFTVEPETDAWARFQMDIATQLSATLTIPVYFFLHPLKQYEIDFIRAWNETYLADPRRYHILCHTKRARIRKKKHKEFVEELTARMDAKRKAREDHVTV